MCTIISLKYIKVPTLWTMVVWTQVGYIRLPVLIGWVTLSLICTIFKTFVLIKTSVSEVSLYLSNREGSPVVRGHCVCVWEWLGLLVPLVRWRLVEDHKDKLRTARRPQQSSVLERTTTRKVPRHPRWVVSGNVAEWLRAWVRPPTGAI